jgi:hypothetical protein
MENRPLYGDGGAHRRLFFGFCFASFSFVRIIHRGSGVVVLPAPDHPMLFLLLLRNVQRTKMRGLRGKLYRQSSGPYFVGMLVSDFVTFV